MWWIFPAVAAFEVAVTVGLGSLIQPDQMAFYWGFGLGVAAALVIVLGDTPPQHIERWREGWEGEKATAKALRPLVKRGWIAIHDIETNRGNLDHLVIGPPGVFVVETKRLRGSLVVHQGVLSVTWLEEPGDGYTVRSVTPRMHRARADVLRRLERNGVTDIPVQPVVVLWGKFDQRSLLSRGVAWIQGKQLAERLVNRPPAIDADGVTQVAALLSSEWPSSAEG